MKKHFTWSNLIFVIAISLMLYKPSRVFIIRQLSFSPLVSEAKEYKRVSDYSWVLSGLNSSNINFSELKGKVIFLNFWATWCPPCIAEMPSIQEFYNDYKNKIAFVFVTSDDWEEIENFYQENGYNLPVYQSLAGYPKGLPTVSSIPKTFIIDKKGFIRVNKTGAANWSSQHFRKVIDTMLKV